MNLSLLFLIEVTAGRPASLRIVQMLQMKASVKYFERTLDYPHCATWSATTLQARTVYINDPVIINVTPLVFYFIGSSADLLLFNPGALTHAGCYFSSGVPEWPVQI